MTSPYTFLSPTSEPVPILLSIPHCGIEFPSPLRDEYVPGLIEKPDDTDWFVHKLYSFAPAMGITVIHANYSRWVIDLNRDPKGAPLYSDGRLITGLCPTTTFVGEPLYRDRRTAVDDREIERRVELYFKPYHLKIEEELQNIKKKFGSVLLWDCHSIRQVVQSIQKEKFPDLILGNADGKSASQALIEPSVSVLGSDAYSFSHNSPFKGGYITRNFGRPAQGIHALQLEMTKVNYMDDSEQSYHETRASKMADLLKKCFQQLIPILLK
jgi:N-formylglutamate deformylase